MAKAAKKNGMTAADAVPAFGKGEGSKRFLCHVTALDQRCIEHIRATHGQGKAAEAVRYALRQERQRADSGKSNGRAERIAAAVKAEAEGADCPALEKWHQLYEKSDFEAMARLVTVHDFASKAAAIRFAVRAQAAHDGMKGV
jgi:Arc/MetJ-type ribon-helix-helix transcriptional regulator